MQRVIVTGGAGMIGRRLVRKLASAGCQVAVFDNLSSGLPPPADARFVHGDIRDAGVFAAFVSSFAPEFVFHLAAVHHVPTCAKLPLYSMAVNILGAENVLQACDVHSLKGLVIASSAAVYAQADGALIEDATEIEASDNYSLCKITNERQAALWSQRTGRALRIARIFNAVAHDDPNGHLFPELIAQFTNAREGRVELNLGNIDRKRDYVDAQDVADALYAMMLDAPRTQQDTFNIAKGIEHSVADIARVLAEHFGMDITIKVDPGKQRSNDRLGLLGSPSKAADILNWRSQHSLNEIVARACNGLLDE